MLDFVSENPHMGRTYWKFPEFLLSDIRYHSELKRKFLIRETTEVLVYSLVLCDTDYCNAILIDCPDSANGLTVTFLWNVIYRKFIWYLAAICCPHSPPSSSCLSNGSSGSNPTKFNKYLHIQSFIYLLIPNICWLFVMSTEQRLVIMSVSLHTHTLLHCLTVQVLNIKSLLPKYLIHFFHFCT